MSEAIDTAITAPQADCIGADQLRAFVNGGETDQESEYYLAKKWRPVV